MANYTTIITEAGQTVADLALQAYGTASLKAMQQLVADNPAVLAEGVGTLVPAGSVVYVDTDFEGADLGMQAYFSTKIVNSTYQEGTANEEVETEGEVSSPPSTTELVVGQRDQWRIEIHMAWKEGTQELAETSTPFAISNNTTTVYHVYGGSVVVLANGDKAEAAIMSDQYEDTPDPTMAQGITARYLADNIVLSLNTSNVKTLKYKIVSAV